MRLYLETSVPNFLFVDDAPEKRRHTERLFREIRQGLHDVWVSDLYNVEVNRTTNLRRREELRSVLTDYQFPVLPLNQAAEALALEYVAEQAFTMGNWADALHVAVAVLAQVDVIVSWNFNHIVRPWTIRLVETVNRRKGFQPMVICTPEEVSPDDI